MALCLGLKAQCVLLVFPPDDQPQPFDLGMAGRNIGHLFGSHEQTPDLGGLICPPHPAANAPVGASARRFARQKGGEVARGEPQHRTFDPVLDKIIFERALVEHEEATLKRLRKRGAAVALEPANAAYETRIFGPDRVKIQGKLAGLYRRYN